MSIGVRTQSRPTGKMVYTMATGFGRKLDAVPANPRNRKERRAAAKLKKETLHGRSCNTI